MLFRISSFKCFANRQVNRLLTKKCSILLRNGDTINNREQRRRPFRDFNCDLDWCVVKKNLQKMSFALSAGLLLCFCSIIHGKFVVIEYSKWGTKSQLTNCLKINKQAYSRASVRKYWREASTPFVCDEVKNT